MCAVAGAPAVPPGRDRGVLRYAEEGALRGHARLPGGGVAGAERTARPAAGEARAAAAAETGQLCTVSAAGGAVRGGCRTGDPPGVVILP